MARTLKVVPLLHILLLLCLPVFGQTGTDPYDAALDRYEEICDRCLLLRASAAQGKSIPRRELTDLLRQLGRLRKTLSDASGNMSEAQRQRFATIRSKYAGTPPAERASRPSLRLPTVSRHIQAGAVADSLSPARVSESVLQALQGELTDPVLRPARWLLTVQVGIVPDLSYGIMAGWTGRRLGAYLSARSNGQFQTTEYACLSDGTTGAGSIWTTGQNRVNRWHCAAGVLVRLTGGLWGYAGGGYGTRTLAWQDNRGAWTKVTDRSFQGWAAECGLAYSFHRLTLSAGCSTVRSGYLDATLGLGLRF